MRYQLRATDTLAQHATHALDQWRASVNTDYPAWIDADDSGLVCHDCGTVFVDAVSSDRYGDTRAQLAAYRAASFFAGARAARIMVWCSLPAARDELESLGWADTHRVVFSDEHGGHIALDHYGVTVKVTDLP